MAGNWFKVYRNLRGSFSKNIKRDCEIRSVYILLVEKANWQDGTKLKRGELMLSEREISYYEPNLNRGNVRKILDNLVKSGHIKIDIEKSGRKKLISKMTICNYDTEQGDDSPDLSNCGPTKGPQKAHKRPTKGPQNYPESLDNSEIPPTKGPQKAHKRPTKGPPITKELKTEEKEELKKCVISAPVRVYDQIELPPSTESHTQSESILQFSERIVSTYFTNISGNKLFVSKKSQIDTMASIIEDHGMQAVEQVLAKIFKSRDYKKLDWVIDLVVQKIKESKYDYTT